MNHNQILELLKKNKKGEINGLSVSLAVMIVMAVVVILGFLIIVISSSLSTISVGSISTTLSFNNATSNSNMTEGVSSRLAGVDADQASCSMTVTTVTRNATQLVAAGNYTVSGCTIIAIANGLSPFVNASYWNVTGSYSFSRSGTYSTAMTNNVSSGVSGFFRNASTWFSILSVLVIIGIIALVLYYVKKFNTEAGI